MSREFETLETLIRVYYGTEGASWIAVALLDVVDLIGQYYDITTATDEELEAMELPEEFDMSTLPQATIDQLYDSIHAALVHQIVPMTEAQRIAEEDQQAAEFTKSMENFESFKLLDTAVDESGNVTFSPKSLDDLFQPKNEEE